MGATARSLHALFADARIRGEWFKPSAEIEALVAFQPILWREVIRAAVKSREIASA